MAAAGGISDRPQRGMKRLMASPAQLIWNLERTIAAVVGALESTSQRGDAGN